MMRRFAIGLAMLMALVSMPARAQETGLPTWLIGTWCGALGGEGAKTRTPPQICDEWVAGPDGTLENRVHRGNRETAAEASGRIVIEEGRLVLRGGMGGDQKVEYREVSRGPQEIVFENQLPGIVRRMTLRREGDLLIEDLTIEDRDQPQRTEYRLQP